MTTLEDFCVDCGLPCLGEACPNQQVKRFYCDQCGAQEQLYVFAGQELCLFCIADLLEQVT